MSSPNDTYYPWASAEDKIAYQIREFQYTSDLEIWSLASMLMQGSLFIIFTVLYLFALRVLRWRERSTKWVHIPLLVMLTLMLAVGIMASRRDFGARDAFQFDPDHPRELLSPFSQLKFNSLERGAASRSHCLSVTTLTIDALSLSITPLWASISGRHCWLMCTPYAQKLYIPSY